MWAPVQGKVDQRCTRLFVQSTQANPLHTTSIWLLDARDALAPSAQLEGFDISFDAAPPAGVIPPNVSFRHWDVRTDLPADLAGVFDVVHVRFLSFVLLDNDAPAVVQKLFKMLSKPI